MAVRFQRRVDGTISSITENEPVVFSVMIAGAQANGPCFIADGDYEIVNVMEVHSVAGNAASTLDIKKCTGTQAPTAGTSVLTSTFAIDSTANTVVTKNLASGLTTTQATRRITTGDRLAAIWAGTVTGYVGTFQVNLKKIQSATANY